MRTEEARRKREWKYRLISFLVGLITFILCTLFLNEDAFAASSFSDVLQKDWHCKFVTELSGEGIVSGYPDGTFRPRNTVTLGHFLSMAMQTADNTGALEPYVYEEKSGAALAASGGKTHWARPFYDRALDQGVLFGDELTAAALDRPISREWMAVIGSRLLPEGVKTGSEDYDEVRGSIADIEEMSPHSFEIVTSYRAGLLSGYTDGTFRPEGHLTRAEAAAVIWNLRNVWSAQGDEADPGQEEGRDEEQKVPEQEGPVKDEPSVYPAVSWEMDPPDFPVGTLAFYGTVGGPAADLKPIMQAQIEDEAMAAQLYEAFRGFAGRAALEENLNKQGLRKEYICGYPVLTESVEGEIRMYVKPKGSETRFWGVKPGQVAEEFF